MQKSLVITGAALGFLVLGAIGLILVQKGTLMAQRSQSQIHAPEFPPGSQWLNTESPLRGKVVLLDSWTYCCINCMHVLPELKALERKYPHQLVVIGVHSAKFSNERDSDNIRQAIVRYDIEPPVVNDAEFRLWRGYGVRARPTLVLIDPSGEVTSLRLNGLAIPAPIAGFASVAWIDGETIALPPHNLKASVDGQLVIHFHLPSGYKLNPAAPIHYAVHVSGAGLHVPGGGRPQAAHVIELPLTIPFRTESGAHQAALDVEVTFYWCRDDDAGVCMIQSARWHVPVDIAATHERQDLTLSTAAYLQDVADTPLSRRTPLEYKGKGAP